MENTDRYKRRPFQDGQGIGLWDLIPKTLLALSLLVIPMSLWISKISDRELTNFAMADAVMDMQILVATSHLWLEELQGGDSDIDLKSIWANLYSALALCETLLNGGKKESGHSLSPLSDPQLRRRAERVKALVSDFRANAIQRQQELAKGSITNIDRGLDAIFAEFQKESLDLERMIEENHVELQNQSRRALVGILVAWILIVVVFMWGVITARSQRLLLEIEIHNANNKLLAQTEELKEHRENLKELVDTRTAELEAANKQLQDQIIERKRINESLAKSRKRYKRLFTEFSTLAKSVNDSLVLFSPDLRMLWTNNIYGPCSAAAESGGEGKGCCPSSYTRTQTCKECPAASSLLFGYETASQSISPDGRVWEVKAYPVKSEDDQVSSVMTVSTDITDKIKFQAEALRVGHLASLGELAAGVAHEINNPVNGVINYTQMLIDEHKKTDQDINLHNRILKEGRRIAGIVRSLLSFARENTRVREYVDIHEILSDTLELCNAQLRKDGITLNIELPAEPLGILANAQEIQQVFLNLLNNARYALNQKFLGASQDKIFSISGEKLIKNGMAYVKITFFDRGIGIPADITAKIFNPFFSTKPRGLGTGLGLSISHGIVTDHDGELSVDSVEGQFTKFHILLPRSIAHA